MAVGRMFDSPVDMTGNSTGRPPASQTPRLTCSAIVAQVRVAGRQLRPGVADADDRPAVEHVGRQALVAHPAAMDEAVFVVLPEPGSGAVGSWFVGHSVQFGRAVVSSVSILVARGPDPARLAWGLDPHANSWPPSRLLLTAILAALAEPANPEPAESTAALSRQSRASARSRRRPSGSSSRR